MPLLSSAMNRSHGLTTLRALTIGLALAGSTNADGQNFGIKFLGNTSDPVTGTAGVIPIGNWNNIDQTTPPAAILGSDGSTTANFSFTGGQTANKWNSGLTGDGMNFSLLHGFLDAGNYGGTPATATISGLPKGQAYDVYLYTHSDAPKPGNLGDHLPNYSVNGVNYYAPCRGNQGITYTTYGAAGGGGYGAAGFIKGTPTNANSGLPIPAASYANYIVISNVTPSGGTITIVPNSDGASSRSTLNGFQLVPNDSSATFGVKFLGNTTDSVTGPAGVVPTGNWNNISPGAVSTTITGSDGSTTASFDLSGGQAGNAWNSGGGGDGGNLSLFNGFLDAGNYGGSPATAVVGGLTAASYNVYLYCESDGPKPDRAGVLLPNYSVNQTVYYFPVMGHTATSGYTAEGAAGIFFNDYTPTYVRSTTLQTNSNQPQPVSYFGNYTVISNVVPIGSVITVIPSADGSSDRSALNGIELVPSDSSAAFGIHFMGDISSPVFNAAGVVPISVWNNFGPGAVSTSIVGSDGTTAASFNLSGAQAANAWHNSLTDDGGDMTLLHGYLDAGNYGGDPAVISVGSLTAPAYTVYIYHCNDQARPFKGTGLLPNYAVNGVTNYTCVAGTVHSDWTSQAAVVGEFNGFVSSTTTNANTILPPSALAYGNYIKLPNVVATDGQITIQAEADSTTFRSPLNAIELVAVAGPNITITRNGPDIILNWSSGHLLEAPSIAGPWTTNSLATSPYTNSPSKSQPQMFYRAILP